MFVAINRDDFNTMGPFTDERNAVEFFLTTDEGRFILGITESEAADWGTPYSGDAFQLTLQDFQDTYGLIITEVAYVGDEGRAVETILDEDAD